MKVLAEPTTVPSGSRAANYLSRNMRRCLKDGFLALLGAIDSHMIKYIIMKSISILDNCISPALLKLSPVSTAYTEHLRNWLDKCIIEDL
jgi:hypothetical protein